MTAVPADASGRVHRAAGSTARIVSLVPSLTELLFHLGLGKQVVGRTTFCIHPRGEVDRVPRIGGTKNPRLARIGQIGATHVLVNIDENRREDAEGLEAMGTIVVATHPLGPQDNLPLFHLVGALFNRTEAAEALAHDFQNALDALRLTASARPRHRVLYLIWREPWMSVSADTYIARTLAEAGIDTVPVDAPGRYPPVTADNVDWSRVDAVLLSSEPYPFKSKHVDEIRRLAGRKDLPVTFIDAEMTSWYGSRAVAGCRYLESFKVE